jgi:hypothetical protein
LAAHPVPAQADGTAATFWKAVQVTCNRAAAKPAGKLGRRIAQTAIDEFTRFDGHQIDSNGRLFRFGLTEAEHEEDDGGVRQAAVGHLGWWQVMKYWWTLFGDEAPEKLEVRGYRDASTLTQGSQDVELLRTNAARLLHEAESVTDPAAREILREAALRATIIDTSWSAAFVSYVVRESGVDADSFRFANAHRVYIYDAFATIFRRKTDRLFRLASDGTGILPDGALPEILLELLTDTACKLASHFLTICIRAIDYCPPVDITFGELVARRCAGPKCILSAVTSISPSAPGNEPAHRPPRVLSLAKGQLRRWLLDLTQVFRKQVVRSRDFREQVFKQVFKQVFRRQVFERQVVGVRVTGVPQMLAQRQEMVCSAAVAVNRSFV